MLCSKCYKDIPQGKEIQIKGSIICQECSQKPVGYCATCSPKKMLYYKDKVYESSKGTSSGLGFWLFSISDDSSETVTQCEECYQNWKKRKNQTKKWIGKIMNSFIFNLALLFFTFSILYFIYPKILKNFDNASTWLQVSFLISAIVVFIVFMMSWGLDRYKIRERDKNKQKNKKTKNKS